MSSVRKLTIKRGLRSPFSRKSSKKDRDEKEKEYDDDVATTDSKKGGVGSVSNEQNLPVLRESSSRSRKWPFRGKSGKQRSTNNGKTEVKETPAAHAGVVLLDATNINSRNSANSTHQQQPGSNLEKVCGHDEAKRDHDAGYATTEQNGYPSNNCDFEQYVTPVRRNLDIGAEESGDDSSFPNSDSNSHGAVCCTSSHADKRSTPDSEDSSCCIEDYVKSGMNELPDNMDSPVPEHDTSSQNQIDDAVPCPVGENGAPKLPPKPPSLRGRRISQINDNAKADFIEEVEPPPPRPPARQRNRTMGRDPNPPHLRGIPIADTDGSQYETVQIDYPNRPGGGLAAELAKLPRQPWYWGPLTQEEAEEKLKKRSDGSFLVRDSSDERYLLSLSFNSHGRTLHTRIEYRNGLFSLNDSEGHASIVELVELAVRESRSGVYGYMRDSLGLQSYPAQLKNWVSRFTEVRPLQHLCRFVIREVYPRHHIQRLPLPKKIKGYILENQY